MPIYKQPGSDRWHVDITAPDGRRIRRSTGTEDKQQAQEYHDRLKADLWRVGRLGEKPPRSFDEACLRWLESKSHKKSLDDDKLKMSRLRPIFKKRKLYLHELDNDSAQSIVAEAAPAAGQSTRNRYLALIRAMLKEAAGTWKWLETMPVIKLGQEPTIRVRWITPAEAQRLIGHLPEHLVPVVRFALATGLRKANIYGLRWAQIDMQRHVAWIHPDEAKAGKAIGVPLNQTAVEAIKGQLGKHHEYVFTYAGRPITTHGQSFARACKAAGIENFRFHDLRHTWASWLIQAGVGLAELQELGGWESVEMVRRYAHLAPDHMHEHSSKIDKLMSYSRHSGKMSGNEERKTGSAGTLTR